MATFRRKPKPEKAELVEAFQMTAERWSDRSNWPDWLIYAVSNGKILSGKLVETPTGLVFQYSSGCLVPVIPGYYIVRDWNGRIFPVSKYKFNDIYEPVT